jgi:hypothetical protein
LRARRAFEAGEEHEMTDPRTPETKEARLPDALDQTPSAAPLREAEERGSEDAQLLAGAGAAEGDVENDTPGRTSD